MFSHLNNNKNKLRDCLAVCTVEAIIKKFPGDFEVNQRPRHFHGEVKENILKI